MRSYCPFYKTVGMMKNLIAFYELASQAVDSTAQLEPERRILWATIRDRFGGDNGLLHELTSMKFKARSLYYYCTVYCMSVHLQYSRRVIFFVRNIRTHEYVPHQHKSSVSL